MVRIAVVEDDRAIVDLLTEIFAEQGWTVSGHDGAGCLLPILRHERPDLILLDVRLPGPMSGWDYLDQIQCDPVLHDVPVIMWAAASDEYEARHEWLEECGTAILEKPFDLDTLFRVIEASLQPGRRRAPRATGA